ncbi:hypothetical protein PFBG_06067 [Plasmodium falciparum 7G8]|uniref:Uncharacterized protein n=1 Tax=Plasmodium falciparum (isolate 7G8) TaxID=57266 RepID=W7ESN7_PLAF8|nr:hypothetical protein PFBG_06067 [Plasmodium falciparum 7G8]
MNYVVISCNGSHYVCCDVILFLSLTIIYNYFVQYNLHNKLKHFVKNYEREHVIFNYFIILKVVYYKY